MCPGDRKCLPEDCVYFTKKRNCLLSFKITSNNSVCDKDGKLYENNIKFCE